MTCVRITVGSHLDGPTLTQCSRCDRHQGSPSASALHSFEVVRTETCARLEEMRDSGSIENASQIAFHMLGYSATSVSIACKYTLLEPLAALSLLGPRALHAALCCSTFASRAGLTAGLKPQQLLVAFALGGLLRRSFPSCSEQLGVGLTPAPAASTLGAGVVLRNGSACALWRSWRPFRT